MEDRNKVLELAAGIVAAYVGNHSVPQAELPKLISEVYQALCAAAGERPAPDPESKPAVSIRKSITPDYLVCFEDGKRFKTLKRHLRSHYNLTPDQYREKWGLPADYPMVAPNYATARSNLAKRTGLGKRES